ncbi:MAG: C10 family peptidase, partial [Muribaculaceae bacterium]|nr:C10 family peptidase [Muribaculaceae bacterium]
IILYIAGGNNLIALAGFKELGYSNAELENFIVPQCITYLNSEGPVYITGVSYRGGHAWVVDGYDNYSTAYDYTSMRIQESTHSHVRIL